MNKDQILNQILAILHTVKEDKSSLEKILNFLIDEIYEEKEEEIVISEKYKKLVHDVAENIDCGLICSLTRKLLR